MSACKHRCGDCGHFAAWIDFNIIGDEPEGVCTAPRPLLGPAPNREVRRRDGKGCQAFTKNEG